MLFLKTLFTRYTLCLLLMAMALWSPVATSTDYRPVVSPIEVIMSAGGVEPSYGDVEWNPDFSVLGSRSASEYMVTMFSEDFGLSHEQASQAFIHSNNGTAIAAWGEIAAGRSSSESHYPSNNPGDTWRWLRQVISEYESNYGNLSVTGTQYSANINSITGVGFAGVVDGGLMSASAIESQVIGSRIAQLKHARQSKEYQLGHASFGAYPSQYSAADYSHGIWAAPFMTIQDVDERNGYAPYQFQAFGAALGYDHTLGDLTLGGAFVYNRARVKDKWVVASEGRTDNYALAVYGTYRAPSNFFVDASGGYQYGKNRYKRYLASYSGGSGVVDADFVDQKNHTDTWWIGAKVGYEFDLFRNISLTPSAGLTYQSATGSSFTSHSRAHGVNNTFERMHVGDIDKAALILPLDLYADYMVNIDSCSTLSFRAGGGIDFNLKREAATGSMRYVGWNSEVDIVGGKPGRNSWHIGAGAKYQTPRFDVSLDYRHDGGWKKAHNVSGMVGVKF